MKPRIADKSSTYRSQLIYEISTYFVTFRKRVCLRKRGKRTVSQAVIGQDEFVEYKANSGGESYTQLGVSDQRVKMEDRHNYLDNPESDAYAHCIDGNTLGEEPGHIEHTYFVESTFNLKGNSGSTYSTIPESCEGRDEGTEMTDDDYSYAYGHIPNRATNKYCF